MANGLALVAALRELGFTLTDAEAAEIARGKDFVQLTQGDTRRGPIRAILAGSLRGSLRVELTPQPPERRQWRRRRPGATPTRPRAHTMPRRRARGVSRTTRTRAPEQIQSNGRTAREEDQALLLAMCQIVL